MALPEHDTLAFDVYGTLVDTAGVTDRLAEVVGDRAAEFAERWRATQLDYTWRRALMRRYVDFDTCTAQALEHTAGVMGVALSDPQRQALHDGYSALPAFPDAGPALTALTGAGTRLVAFTNGTASTVDPLLERAGLRGLLDDVVSTDEIGSFKPDPAVYHHLLERVATRGTRTVVVSGNSFDVLGALSAGLRAAWLRRSDTVVLDPWQVEPDLTISSLTELGRAPVSG